MRNVVPKPLQKPPPPLWIACSNRDTIRLAAKHGDNPRSWRDVGYWLIRKSSRAVYNDPVVKHGYCRGTEPVAYVDQIITTFVRAEALNEGARAVTQNPAPVGIAVGGGGLR